MAEQQKYATAKAFRVALKDRVKRLCRENTAVRPDELYRKITFDRFLARFDYKHWTLKGGYSLERRLPQIRSTKDIDLASTDAQLILADKEEQANLLMNAIRKELAASTVSDYFSFELKKIKLLPGFGKGGVRCLVTALLDQEIISTFQLDIVAQDKCHLPRETVLGTDFLAFAGIRMPEFQASACEEVFAEKIHAYTKPRDEENTRVRDIIDLYRLIEKGLEPAKVLTALTGVFAIRDEHILPDQLPEPPSSWQSIFDEFAKENALDLSLGDAFQVVQAYYQQAHKD